MINARAETVYEKPAFRRAFKSRRLLIPVDGFYEWFPTQQLGKSGKPLKQPFYIHPANPDDVLALAGLCGWRDPDKAEDDPDKLLTSFTITTTTATDDVGRIHDRMPMAVTPGNLVRYPMHRAASLEPASTPWASNRTPGRMQAIHCKVQHYPVGEQCRARCVPDRTVIPGISRSLRDNPPPELTCG